MMKEENKEKRGEEEEEEGRGEEGREGKFGGGL